MSRFDIDIIERLRYQKRYTVGIVTVTMEDAAAEIERLRMLAQFTMEDMNLLRQWFNAVEDMSPEYLEQKDRDLMQKIAKVWFRTGAAPQPVGAGQP